MARKVNENGKHETCLMAIDTGLNAIGFARWDRVEYNGLMIPPTTAGVLQLPPARQGDPWEKKATDILMEFMTGPWSGGMGGGNGWPKVCVAEWPEFRAGDAVGHAAMSNDAIPKLFLMVGMHKRLAETCGAKFALAPVSQWKGQLPKKVVARRIATAIGCEDQQGVAFVDDAWDAVGIGLWYLGHKLNDTKKFGGAK